MRALAPRIWVLFYLLQHCTGPTQQTLIAWDLTQPASAHLVRTTQTGVPRMWFESCWQGKV